MNILNNKKKSLILCALLVVLIVIVWASVGALKNPASAAETVKANMNNIGDDDELAYSSNPYDYIKGSKSYSKIIALGVDAIPELEQLLASSKSNGLREYIMAIAIEEISNVDIKKIKDDEYAWENAKEFNDEWHDVIDGADVELEKIINSDQLSKTEKVEQISDYGVLAVPVLDEMITEGKIDATADREVAKKIIDDNELTKHEYKVVEEILAE